jgi:hypothetical protein
MNMNNNTDHSLLLGCKNQKSFFRFLKHVFTVNGTSFLDVFQYSNQYNEKLQIIYANIRVWILEKTDFRFSNLK